MELSFERLVGYTRLEGEQDYQQLDEMYQALRLYVNGFQPSLKLQAKHFVDRKVRRVYDAAKTPVQRLLLSQVLTASKEHQLLREVRLLDPLRLFHHLQDLQLALLNFSPDAEEISPVALLPFCIQQCIGKSHTAVLERGEESWQEEEVIHIETADLFSSGKQEDKIDHRGPSTCPSAVTSCQQTMEESSFPSQPTSEKETTRKPAMANDVAVQNAALSSTGQPQASHAPLSFQRSRHTPSDLTIEQAVYHYLENQRIRHRRPKTLEWHRKALGLFQQYLLTEHQCILPGQMSPMQVRGGLAFLSQMKNATGATRSPGTVESYARSVRAFCHWLVHQKYLPETPFAQLPLPQVQTCVHPPLEPEEWEKLLLACRPSKEAGMVTEQATDVFVK